MTDDFDFDQLTTPSGPAPAAPTFAPQPPTPNPQRTVLGEVIAASYSRFTAESFRLHELPPLGGIVVVENVLGVVYEAKTEGLGPIDARGGPGDADGAVYAMHPDLERTLRSQFAALIIGHYAPSLAAPHPGPLPGGEGARPSRIIYTYPDCPPRLHYKATLATADEVCAITERPHYLRLLLGVQDAPVDEVIIHLLARAYAMRGGDRAHLLHTTEFLGRLLKGQYDRLVAILETVESLIADVPEVAPARAGAALPAAIGNIRP